MTHNLNILATIYLCIVALSCHAMEKATIPHANFRQLTIPTNPRQALYLTNNRVAISGEKGCSIIDPTTDTLIKQISYISYPHIALHPNATKIALAYPEKVTIYNAQTGEQEWNIKNPLLSTTIISSIFSPLEDSILINYPHNTTCHTRYNHKYLFFAAEHHHPNRPIIAFHPTKSLMCIADNPGDMTIIYQKTCNIESRLFSNASHEFCEYSPNGSLIALGNKKSMYILDPESTDPQTPLKIKKGERVSCIKFHPNSAVLATLSNIRSIVRYWDVVTQQLIVSMAPLSAYCSDFFNKNTLSFSPDGKNLLVTVSDKCFVTPVPFEIIYQSDAKKRAPFAYWLLKNYQRTHNNEIPDEIIQLLMYTLLETLKR
jgi:WD40 repeat protein